MQKTTSYWKRWPLLENWYFQRLYKELFCVALISLWDEYGKPFWSFSSLVCMRFLVL